MATDPMIIEAFQALIKALVLASIVALLVVATFSFRAEAAAAVTWAAFALWAADVMPHASAQVNMVIIATGLSLGLVMAVLADQVGRAMLGIFRHWRRGE